MNKMNHGLLRSFCFLMVCWGKKQSFSWCLFFGGVVNALFGGGFFLEGSCGVFSDL